MERRIPYDYKVGQSSKYTDKEEAKEYEFKNMTTHEAFKLDETYENEFEENDNDSLATSQRSYTTVNARSSARGKYKKLPKCSFDSQFLEKEDFTESERQDYYDSLQVDEEELDDKLSDKYDRGMYIDIAIITEKRSVAKRIAQVLGKKGTISSEWWEGLETQTFYGSFREYEARFRIVYTSGHIYQYNFDKEENIFKSDPFDILLNKPTYKYLSRYSNAKYRRKKEPNYNEIETYISYSVKGADIVMLWLDNDISGENICFQCIDLIREHCPEMDEE